MPHLHLETTPGLVEEGETDAILGRLVARLGTYPTIAVRGVKAYRTVYPEYAIGDGGPDGFVHLTVAILDGRAPSLVADMADGMYAELKACFRGSLDASRAKATMELREMASATYRK